MKFGKLENIENHEFELPVDHPSNDVFFDHLNIDGPNPQIYIGATSWNVPGWKSKIYPAKSKSSDFLSHYSEFFNSIELNTTYYRIPKIENVLKWKEQVQGDFKFCPKVLQYISRAKDLGVGSNRIKEFSDTVSVFEESLGSCFMQLPPYFSIDRIRILEEFLKVFPSNIQLSIEIRNESFFESINHFEKLLELLIKYQRSLVITDVAGRRDVLHMALMTDFVIIRFGGNDLHPSDYKRADDWAERISGWFHRGMKEIYFMIHQKNGLLSPDFSSYLSARLETKLDSNRYDQIKKQLSRLKLKE